MEGLKKKFILSENSNEFVQLLTRVVFASAGDRPLNSFGWGMKVYVHNRLESSSNIFASLPFDQGVHTYQSGV